MDKLKHTRVIMKKFHDINHEQINPEHIHAKPKWARYLGVSGGLSRYPISPSSLSKAVLKARVLPFRDIAQIY